MKKFVVYLTKEELMLLDGKCSYGVQRIVNRVKNANETIAKIRENVNYDDMKKQAITHCVVCKESVKNKSNDSKSKNVIVRISGYYLGRFNDGKPILVCDNCMEEYLKDIIDEN